MEAESTTIALTALTEITPKTREEKRYAIVWDKTGNAGTFYGYKATLIDFHKEKVKATLGK